MKTRRRDFLRLLSVAGGSLALPRFALADGHAATPERFVVVTSTQGCVYENWKMRPDGESDINDFSFDLAGLSQEQFSTCLRPLHRHREKLTVLDGLSLISGIASGKEPHAAGGANALTGYSCDEVEVRTAYGPSIDRLIADALGGESRFTSIDLSFEDQPMLFGADGLPIPTARRVEPLRTALRSHGLETGETMLDRVFELSHSREARDVLGQADHEVVDQYLDVLSSALRRQVSPPENPILMDPRLETDEAKFGNLLQAYFTTDATRVATLQTRGFSCEEIGAPPAGNVHDLWAHNAGSDPLAREYMTEHSRLQAERFAEILDALDSIREGDGTLLDSTTVLWVNELGGGEHIHDPWPVVIAGGRKFRHGRYLHWAPETSGFQRYFQGFEMPAGTHGMAGVPNQRLLTRVAEAFALVDANGNRITEFGEQSVVAMDGTVVDLGGTLDRLELL